MKFTKAKQICLSIILIMVFVLVSVASASANSELQALYTAAKAEGEMVWQYFSSAKSVKPVVKAFQARYPGIKVEVVSIGSSSIGTRIITESSAGKLTMDVATCGSVYLASILERNLLEKHDWAKIVPDLDPSKVLYDGRYIYFGDSGKAWAYNTTLVSKSEMPRSIEDTLDPKWGDGRISLRAAKSGFIYLWPVWKKDPQKVKDYIKKFVKQQVLPEKRTSVVTNRVVTGECLLGIGNISDIPAARKKGAPIAFCPITPAAGYPSGVFIPKGGVKHPNAAKLFIAWVASKEGLAEFEKIGRGTYHPPESSMSAKALADAGIDFVRVTTLEDIKEYNGPFTKTVMQGMDLMPK